MTLQQRCSPSTVLEVFLLFVPVPYFLWSFSHVFPRPYRIRYRFDLHRLRLGDGACSLLHR